MIRVLLVDDSAVFRGQVAEALREVPDVEIVGIAANGRLALAKLSEFPVDVAIVDLEMPEMNGIELLEEMMKRSIQTRTIFFASPTKGSALASLKALNRGAFDFIVKPQAATPRDGEAPISTGELIRQAILPKLRQAGALIPAVSNLKVAQGAFPAMKWEQFSPRAIVIGCSTGGPRALDTLFDKFNGPICSPIFIVQHMPPVFTATLAEHLSRISGVQAKEATHGEVVLDNRIYIAPGNFHMKLKLESGQVRIALDQSAQRNSVRPAVDHLFETAAEIYGSALLGFVLTGMGEDGRAGAIALKRAGAGVITQTEKSCVVYGMPKSVQEAGASDREMDLLEIREFIKTYSHTSLTSMRKVL